MDKLTLEYAKGILEDLGIFVELTPNSDKLLFDIGLKSYVLTNISKDEVCLLCGDIDFDIHIMCFKSHIQLLIKPLPEPFAIGTVVYYLFHETLLEDIIVKSGKIIEIDIDDNELCYTVDTDPDSYWVHENCRTSAEELILLHFNHINKLMLAYGIINSNF